MYGKYHFLHKKNKIIDLILNGKVGYNDIESNNTVDIKVFNYSFHLIQENKDNLVCLKEVHDFSNLTDDQKILSQYNYIIHKYPSQQEKNLSVKDSLQEMIKKHPELLEKLSLVLFSKPTLTSLLEFYTDYLMWENAEPTSVKQKKLHLI